MNIDGMINDQQSQSKTALSVNLHPSPGLVHGVVGNMNLHYTLFNSMVSLGI